MKSMSLPHRIFIYGAPGSGKTTFSVELEKKFGYPLVEGDYLREAVAQKEKTQAEDPFVYFGTTEAFRKFGPLTEGNVIKGLKAVRASMAPYVAGEVSKHLDSFIFEAAFLDPNELNNLGRSVLVVTSDEEKYRRQYFKHREQNNKNQETFRAARMLQAYLLEEARGLEIMVVENNGKMDQILGRIVF
jgi:2-phosphoglycerate kinase